VGAQQRRGTVAAQRRLLIAHQFVNDLFGGHTRAAWRTARQMVIDQLTIRGVQFAVDVRGNQRINRGAGIRHGGDSSVEVDRTTSGVHAKYGTSRYRQGCSACRLFLRRKILPRLVTRRPDETPRATGRRPSAAPASEFRAAATPRAWRLATRGRR